MLVLRREGSSVLGAGEDPSLGRIRTMLVLGGRSLVSGRCNSPLPFYHLGKPRVTGFSRSPPFCCL